MAIAHPDGKLMNAAWLGRLRPAAVAIATGTLTVGFVVAAKQIISQPALSQQAAPAKDVVLQVGIVQRFGTQPTDTVTLQAQTGDRLTIKFPQADGKQQTLTTNTATLKVLMQPLPESQVQERVVLSTHRSFESAEDNANDWRSQGIPVEIAQPKRWQVWAKRDVYTTPLLRRLLIQSLQVKGIQTAFVDSRLLKQQPKAALLINGKSYLKDSVQISAGRGVVQVQTELKDDRNKRFYTGSLRLQPNTYGTYTLVNQVPLEAYLRGVVPNEIGTTAASSVLQVQAILARTYALRNLRRFAVDNYQLCADTQCQVYFGLSGAALATDSAIAATRGKVLTYQNELVDAVYSASTGGITASFNDIWEGPDRPYLTTRVDSVTSKWDLSRQPLTNEQTARQFLKQTKGFNEADQKWFRWQYTSSLTELNKDLHAYLKTLNSPLANFKSIEQLKVEQRSPAGRVQKLRVTTDLGAIDLEKDNILVAFYAPASLFFYLDPVLDAKKKLTGYAFSGGGLGHGVGLSQTGSYHLGKLGWSSDRILSFYYPGTQLQPLNNSIVFWRDPLKVR
ncbi:SpoIID/LytB domain-containing protein [Leptolyngbya sp. Cla-17]|uniref:SpoIID/LytB domain-containing protein n=1 Tax=Leptolyngbya sp. Cla-17 TaxID=2803751 RepID=UPI0018D7A092|nr:SpoIID/LytB domain-containing protein [Leptolyngbya sp. Cla-17]